MKNPSEAKKKENKLIVLYLFKMYISSISKDYMFANYPVEKKFLHSISFFMIIIIHIILKNISIFN